MPTANISQYLPDDLTIPMGRWTITSPIPGQRAGKVLMAMATVSVRTVVDNATNAEGEPVEVDQTAATRESQQRLRDLGIDPETDVSVLLFGQEQLDRLREDDIPEVYIDRATTYAMTYWTFGAEAADQAMTTLLGPDAGTPAPKGRRRSRSGRRTASGK